MEAQKYGRTTERHNEPPIPRRKHRTIIAPINFQINEFTVIRLHHKPSSDSLRKEKIAATNRALSVPPLFLEYHPFWHPEQNQSPIEHNIGHRKYRCEQHQ